MPDLQENGRETGDGPRGCKTDRNKIDLLPALQRATLCAGKRRDG